MNNDQYTTLLVAHGRHVFKYFFVWALYLLAVTFALLCIMVLVDSNLMSIFASLLFVSFLCFMFYKISKRERLDIESKGLVCQSCKKVFSAEEAKHADRFGKCLVCDEDVSKDPLGGGGVPRELSYFQCVLLILVLIGLFVAGVVLLEKTSVLSRLLEKEPDNVEMIETGEGSVRDL